MRKRKGNTNAEREGKGDKGKKAETVDMKGNSKMQGVSRRCYMIEKSDKWVVGSGKEKKEGAVRITVTGQRATGKGYYKKSH